MSKRQHKYVIAANLVCAIISCIFLYATHLGGAHVLVKTVFFLSYSFVLFLSVLSAVEGFKHK